MSDELKSAYLDTSIVVAYVFGLFGIESSEELKQQWPIAEEIFEEIKSGKLIGFISDLVLIELLTVIRTNTYKKLTKLDKKNKYKNIIEFNHDVERYSVATYNKTLDELINIGSEKFKVVKTTMTFSEVIMKCKKLANAHIGNIVHDNTHSKTRFSYKKIEIIDFQHLLLAIEADANVFITFDKGFYNIISSKLGNIMGTKHSIQLKIDVR